MKAESFTSNYLSSINKQFQYYKHLGEGAINQLETKDIFWKRTAEDNSVAVIVKHLHGNMLSRWTDFLNSDGEKEWRQRDREFEVDVKDFSALLEQWEAGWACLFTALSTINSDNFGKTIYIRNQGHSILEAVNRQLCHYSYHIGQIVFIAKTINGNQWKSLSIPVGASSAYNANKFSKEKKKAHFTQEFLKEKDTET